MGQHIELYDHQKELLDINPECHLIAYETGTGKTIIALALAEKNKVSGSLLVVCPKGLKTNWSRHLEKWGIKAILLSKEEFRRDWDKLPPVRAIIVDEAHTFASRTSQMSKNMKKFLKKHNVQYRWFLTATPYLRDPWNIYVLAEHLGHTMNYPLFKATFFYDVKFGRRTVSIVRPHMEQELKEVLLRIGSTKKLEECVDVPEQTYETEYFDLTDSQLKAIDSLQETNHISRWTKVHQICGGSLGENEFDSLRIFDSQKRDRLRELAKENDRMIVVCRYRSETETLAQELSIDIPTYAITGDTENRQEILDELAKKDRYALFVSAQISEGWELPDCPFMVFYSLDFSLKNAVQMEGRVRRINRMKRNTYLYLVVQGEIDEDVYKTLNKKLDFHIELYRKDI